MIRQKGGKNQSRCWRASGRNKWLINKKVKGETFVSFYTKNVIVEILRFIYCLHLSQQKKDTCWNWSLHSIAANCISTLLARESQIYLTTRAIHNSTTTKPSYETKVLKILCCQKIRGFLSSSPTPLRYAIGVSVRLSHCSNAVGRAV